MQIAGGRQSESAAWPCGARAEIRVIAERGEQVRHSPAQPVVLAAAAAAGRRALIPLHPAEPADETLPAAVARRRGSRRHDPVTVT